MTAFSTFTRRGAWPDHSLDDKMVLPGDGRFDDTRRAWNLAIDQRPAAVVFPGSATDVAAAVRYAAERGLRIAAQGTGHNAGPLGSLADTVLLRTDRMRGIRIDPQARTASVEAGVVWLDVVQAAARHGLAALAGSSPDVGVAGYTLGGGVSFLGRKYGLAASHVLAAEVVTADGRLVRADSDHEPGLFWALRGGGGSFGVVTALEFRLLPFTEAYAGVLWYPIERGSEVLHTWSELTRGEIPDELTTVGRFLNLPPIPAIPEGIRGKSFVIVEAYHLGDPAQADELLAPLRALGPVNDTIATVPVPALSHLHMDPEQPVPRGRRRDADRPASWRGDRRLHPGRRPGRGVPAAIGRIAAPRRRARPPPPGTRRAGLPRRGLCALCGRHDSDPGPGHSGHGAGRGGQERASALGRPADVPQLRRDPAACGAVLDRAGLPAAAPDQGDRGPR